MKLHKQHLGIACLVIALVVVGTVVWRQHQKPKTVATTTVKNTQSTSTTPNASQPTAFNKSQYSLEDPNSLWVIVNKTRKLPNGYAPSDLVVPNVALRTGSASQEMHVRQVTAAAMQEMFAAAKAQGVNLMLASGYRSQAYQESLHASYVAQKGADAADLDSARAGYSEHQTGLAFDVEPANRSCEVEECFGSTAEGKWVAAHAYEYGFVMRYLQGKQPITGYVYEPWHFRYVGKDLALQIHNSNGQTLEEFFGLPAAPNYL